MPMHLIILRRIPNLISFYSSPTILAMRYPPLQEANLTTHLIWISWLQMAFNLLNVILILMVTLPGLLYTQENIILEITPIGVSFRLQKKRLAICCMMP